MSRTSPVREDSRGIYVIVNGGIYRPGDVAGYSHAYDMSDGGLKRGDRVQVRHVSQSPLARIRTADKELVWYLYDEPSPEVAKHLEARRR
jgi:hypothetical protein